MQKGPIRGVTSLLVLLALPRLASASDTLPMARASFPILTEPAPSAAPPPVAPPAPIAPPAAAPPPAPAARPLDGPDRVEPKRAAREEDRWMLSLEGATRAPIDAGLQLTFETPAGLRLFGGYGWVPSMYLGTIVGTAADASADPRVGTLLDEGFDGGHAWRAGLGLRPFQSLGLYLDAGYTRVGLRGGLDAAELGGVPGISGGYDVSTTLGLGFVELGYQTKIAQRVVLAAALGVTKVFSAETSVAPNAGASDDPSLRTAAGQVDAGLERYGILPTLTLRLGLDLI